MAYHLPSLRHRVLLTQCPFRHRAPRNCRISVKAAFQKLHAMATSKISSASPTAAVNTTSMKNTPLSATSMTNTTVSMPAVLPRNGLPWLFSGAIVLSLVALSISGYLSFVAFTSSKIAGCGSGGTFDCEHVLHSKWSTFLGLPVAAWASTLYISVVSALAFGARSATAREESQLKTWVWAIVATAAVSAGLAALWFIGLQVFVLKHLCPWCLGAHTCGLLLCASVMLFSPLAGRLKAICAGIGAAGAAVLMTVQTLTPAPLTYTIEEFPAPATVPGDAGTLDAPDAEMFDAPNEDDVFSAPVTLDSRPSPSTLYAIPSLIAWMAAPNLLVTQVAAQDNATEAQAEKEKKEEKKEAEAAKDEPAKDERLVQLASANLKLRAHQWPLIGSPDAKYIFTELFDYTCPHCRATQAAIKGARQKYGDQLAIIVLPVPLSRACNDTIQTDHASHRESCEISKYAIAVWRIAPEKFADYHEWLFQISPLTAAAARSKAEQLVGAQAFNAELAQPHAARYIGKHVEIYRRMGAGPVPKLVFSNTTLTGEMTSSSVLSDTLERQPK